MERQTEQEMTGQHPGMEGMTLGAAMKKAERR